MRLLIIGHTFAYEMECVARLFYPGEKFEVIKSSSSETDIASLDTLVTLILDGDGGLKLLSASLNIGGVSLRDELRVPDATTDKELERLLAVILFKQLCLFTGIAPPWGVLTGIRPAGFCRELMRQGMTGDEVFTHLTKKYLVFPEKARLALETARAGESILAQSGGNSFSLYVSIPLCPSRCLYCSFISHDIKGCMKLIPDYIRLLCDEILNTGRIAAELNLELKTVYIGGGTPTSLEADSLARIMSAIRESFDFLGLAEYTVEAGRPDTITSEKLDIMREYGVTRISVNPQTMNDSVLRLIGRNHTAAQTIEAFYMARETGFDNINMDIIAGLPGDDNSGEGGFPHTVGEILRLKPDNITIHTLTVKRSSSLREKKLFPLPDGAGTGLMVDFAAARLSESGYKPYYMYRQKGTPGNLENTGYSLPGRECLYNVYIMEEKHTILAVGAGAVTKLCHPVLGVKRIHNYKYPYEYIDGYGEILRRKSEVKGFYDRACKGDAR